MPLFHANMRRNKINRKNTSNHQLVVIL